MNWKSACLVFLLLALPADAATPGMFRGEIVGPPSGKEQKGWIYVASPRGMLRRVEITRARVTYAQEVPEEQRDREAARSLGPGVEVIVTAHQGDDGSWRATDIEILRLPRRALPRPNTALHRS